MGNRTNDELYMRLALAEATSALVEGEVPVGAVVVYEDKVIGVGHNSRESGLDISGHAEINALRAAAKARGSWNLEGCTLYVTLEPCLMCAGAIRQSRLSSLVFGAKDEKEGAVLSKFHVFDQDNATQAIVHGVLEEECAAMLKRFFANARKKD